MKREILCKQHAEQLREIAAEPEVVEAGEKIKIVAGTAKRDFKCDFCGKVLPRGSAVFACSVSSPAAPYWPWELECIAPTVTP